MKRISTPKTLSILALLATLSTVAGVGVLQSRKVQAQTETQEKVDTSLQKNSACDGINLPYPEEFFVETEYGCSTLGNFYGIELTPEQEEVRQRAEKQRSDRSDLMEGQIEIVTIPNGSIDVAVRSADGHIPEEAGDAATVANLDDIPNAEQLDDLNARFPEAEFFLSRGIRLTPEQVLEVIRMDREFEDTMLSVMTPEQQRLYLKNMAVMYWIKGSDTDLTDG